MSRSRKKTPIIKYAPQSKDTNNCKWAKRQANKKARKRFDIDDGNSYKKLYNTWQIHDCKSYWSSDKCIRK